MNKKFGGILFLLILTLGNLVVAQKLHLVSDVNEVVINEVCSNNFNLIRDDYDQYVDYIELWNTTEDTLERYKKYRHEYKCFCNNV